MAMTKEAQQIEELLRSLEENSDRVLFGDESTASSFSDFDFLKKRQSDSDQELSDLPEPDLDEEPEEFLLEQIYSQESEAVEKSAAPAQESHQEVPPLLDDSFESAPEPPLFEEPQLEIADEEAEEEENFGENPWDFESGGESRKGLPGKFRDAKVFVGLDIGRRAAKYVVARKKGKDRIIQAFGILNYPLNFTFNYRDVAERIIALLQEKNLLKSAKLNLGICHNDVGIQRISLPQLKKKEMTEAIIWFLKKKFEFQERVVLTDFVILGKKTNKGVEHADILGAIAPKKVVDESIEPFIEKKAIPSALLPLPATLLSLYRAAHLQTESDCIAMVDIGAEKTTIAFIHDDNLEFSRTVPIGGDQITEGMTATIFHEGQAVQLDLLEAERLKREFGFPMPGKTVDEVNGVPIPELGALMRPYLERLASEIQRSIDYYRENYSVDKIDRVYLLGGSAQLKNLLDFLDGEIDEKLELFQFSMHFPLSLSSTDAQTFHNRFLEFGAAVGLAMEKGKEINLLPEPYRKLELFKLQKRVLIYLSLLTFTGLLFISATSLLRITSLKNEYRQLQLEYKKMLPKKHHYDMLLAEKRFLTRKKNIYKSELILDNPLPQILKMISNIFPSDMALTGMSISHEPMPGANGTPRAKSTKGNKKDKKKEAVVPVASFLHLHGVRHHPPPDEGIKLANFMLKLNRTGYFRRVSLLNQFFSEEKDEMRFEIVCEF